MHSKLWCLPVSRGDIATLHAKFRFKILSGLIGRKYFSSSCMFFYVRKELVNFPFKK